MTEHEAMAVLATTTDESRLWQAVLYVLEQNAEATRWAAFQADLPDFSRQFYAGRAANADELLESLPKIREDAMRQQSENS